MSVYNFLINNRNGQHTNGTILYTSPRRGITLATGTKRLLCGGMGHPPLEFVLIILSNLILCTWNII